MFGVPRKGPETKTMIKMFFKKIKVSLMGYFIINTGFNDVLMKVYDNCFDQPMFQSHILLPIMSVVNQ